MHTKRFFFKNSKTKQCEKSEETSFEEEGKDIDWGYEEGFCDATHVLLLDLGGGYMCGSVMIIFQAFIYFSLWSYT